MHSFRFMMIFQNCAQNGIIIIISVVLGILKDEIYSYYPIIHKQKDKLKTKTMKKKLNKEKHTAQMSIYFVTIITKIITEFHINMIIRE